MLIRSKGLYIGCELSLKVQAKSVFYRCCADKVERLVYRLGAVLKGAVKMCILWVLLR